MGQALYRKYRPRSFSETVGQNAITQTLKQALKSGRISHAYLFAGPKGVGKTSVARILAHEVNQLPYEHDNTHLDIIEIDAASNRRIDEIRDLREKVHTAPAAAKYKVYIIDEVHMLTKEAFNALLKTLEEPPAHCIFILATTEAHKLPETIISRTQRFNFRPISLSDTRSHLQKIAKSEKIEIDQDAVNLLAEYGDGSLRDIIGLLDQLSSADGKVTEAEVRNLLGIPSQQAINELIQHLVDGEPQPALVILEKLKEQGAAPGILAREIGSTLRRQLLDGVVIGNWAADFLKSLLEVAASAQPQETLEIAILDAASRSTKTQPVKNSAADEHTDTKKQPKQRKKSTINTPATPRKTSDSAFKLERWNEILSRVKSESPKLYTALRLASPAMEEGRLVLSFQFPLHQKKVKEAKHIELIARLIHEVSVANPPIDCIVDKHNHIEAPSTLQNGQPEPDLRTISNIFGSAEVLES